jgi:NAD+ kinase
MFRFALSANDRHPYLKKITADFTAHFESLGNIHDEAHPDIIFVFGGDGTFLNAVRKMYGKKAPFLLINDGTLGFFKEYDLKELDKFYADFSFENLTFEEHRFLKIEDAYGHSSLSLNEFIVASSIRTLDFAVYLNQGYFMEVHGSGICVCTPFGSTGYNHSLGGSVIGTDEGLGLCLIAPIKNRAFHPLISSLIVGEKDEIGVEVLNDIPFELAGDMRLLPQMEGKKFTIKRSRLSFRLAHVKPFSNYRRMRNAFIEE